MTLDTRLAEELARCAAPLRVGVDIVSIARIRESLDRFGERFVARLFSESEARYAMAAPALAPERLAARFAAKEAALKAFGWTDAAVSWRDIEVTRSSSGACELALHGRAAQLAAAAGHSRVALSLSHDDGYAAAVVATLPADIDSHGTLDGH